MGDGGAVARYRAARGGGRPITGPPAAAVRSGPSSSGPCCIGQRGSGPTTRWCRKGLGKEAWGGTLRRRSRTRSRGGVAFRAENQRLSGASEAVAAAMWREGA